MTIKKMPDNLRELPFEYSKIFYSIFTVFVYRGENYPYFIKHTRLINAVRQPIYRKYSKRR